MASWLRRPGSRSGRALRRRTDSEALMLKISSAEGNRQRLDGGAMYGNVPRAIWAPGRSPTSEHRIELACRAFLVEDAPRPAHPARGRHRRLLRAQAARPFRRRRSAARAARQPRGAGAWRPRPSTRSSCRTCTSTTPAVCSALTARGGLRARLPARSLFRRPRDWERARQPHLRDRASFIPELLELLEGSGRLELVSDESHRLAGPGLQLSRSPTVTRQA